MVGVLPWDFITKMMSVFLYLVLLHQSWQYTLWQIVITERCHMF